MTEEGTGILPATSTKAYDVLLWLIVRQAHHERTSEARLLPKNIHLDVATPSADAVSLKSARSSVNTFVVRSDSAAAMTDASARSIGCSPYCSINSNARAVED